MATREIDSQITGRYITEMVIRYRKSDRYRRSIEVLRGQTTPCGVDGTPSPLTSAGAVVHPNPNGSHLKYQLFQIE